MKIKNLTLAGLGFILLFASCSENETDDEKDSVLMTNQVYGKKGMRDIHYYDSIDPFLNSPYILPTTYTQNTFDLRHDYPSSVPTQPSSYPWDTVTNGDTLTQGTSMAYVDSLKSFISDDMKKMLYQYETWDWQSEDWYQSIWVGIDREPIHGMYVGSSFPPGSLTDQTDSLTTYVLTLYDKTAAVTLGNIWGDNIISAYVPELTDVSKTQYAQGSIIVKFAFVTLSGTEWSPMNGTTSWDIFNNVDPHTGRANSEGDTIMQSVYMMQCDIIVKDTVAAPVTGWVFSTLVYDKNAPGNDTWDKMVPLGSTWGSNPGIISLNSTAVNSVVHVNQALTENWINLDAPTYAQSTLGWDGRLSGPNDGAVQLDAKTVSGKVYPALANVGCISCHSSAQYKFKSFLISTTTLPGGKDFPTFYDPGTTGWMKWFQNRNGETPMDSGAGQIGLDFDMVTAFKAIPMWEAAVKDIEKRLEAKKED